MSKESNKLQRERWKTYIIQLKESTPCMDCGIQYPHYVMEFDHRENNKYYDIGKLLTSKNKLLEEIEKCDIVCANCHSIRTHSRRTKSLRSTRDSVGVF